MSNFDLVLKLFLELAVILAACRIVGLAGARLGQTQVVSEMVDGALLGPSCFGLLAPELQRWVFPAASMPVLYAISQIGLVLYMFLIGLEFDAGLLLGRVRGALLVSWAGIAVPLGLGALAAVVLRDDADLFAPHVSATSGALFLGAAMSITAFPMLARIIYERGLTGTSLGTLALAAGAIGDAGAWCVLAIVLASFGAGPMVAIKAIGGGVVYAVVILTFGRKLLAWFANATERAGQVRGFTALQHDHHNQKSADDHDEEQCGPHVRDHATRHPATSITNPPRVARLRTTNAFWNPP
jgi:Kef-type K+ transport system membrane component KefB